MQLRDFNKVSSRLVKSLLGYLAIGILLTYVLYLRFPNNLAVPNYYGEDGSVYLQNIIDTGWLHATFTPFNGYFIVGLYLLCGVGWLINGLFIGDGLISLPVGFSFISLLFMGFVMALPYLLFQRHYGRIRMLTLVLLSVLLPLPMSPHAVISNIGNQKWLFFYLAFVLVLYRVLRHKQLSTRRIIIIDSALLLCAYTNSTTYLLAPLIAAPYTRDYWKKRHRLNLWKYIRQSSLSDRSFISAIIMGLLMLPQVVYVALHGIPAMPGYLDTPYIFSRSIEIFINRTYLFGITHIINGYLRDSVVLVLGAAFVLLGYKRLKGFDRFVFIAAVYAAGMASLLFVVNRPGVSAHFLHYRASGSGPDQFFFVQTLIMYLPIVLIIWSFRFKPPKLPRSTVPIVLISILTLAGLLSNNVYGQAWRNASPYENDAGSFINQALQSCQKLASDADKVQVTVYPYASGSFAVTAPVTSICNSQLEKYQQSVVDLGLRVQNNDYVTLSDGVTFTQQFTATEDGLSGIRLFISDFGKNKRSGSYQLQLYDKQCDATSEVRTAAVPSVTFDNAYYNVRFGAIPDSFNKQYCFTLKTPVSPYDPLALQRSQTDTYTMGQYTENGQAKAVDIVFSPLYQQEKIRR